MKERRTSLIPIVGALLIALVALYAGSYMALVVPEGIARIGIGNVGGRTFRHISYEHHYRVDSEVPSWLYWPLEQIDRRLRPDAWNAVDWES